MSSRAKGEGSSKVLIRFSTKEYLKAFRTSGVLRMNPVHAFADVDPGAAQRDQLEGVDLYVQPEEVLELRVESGESAFSLEPAGPMQFSTGRTSNLNLLCFTVVDAAVPGDLVDPRMRTFGETFIAITNPVVFSERLREALGRLDQRLNRGLVVYRDTDSYSGDWGVFAKPSALSFQREYRFVASPGVGVALDLELGTLEDCTTPVLETSAIEQVLVRVGGEPLR